MTDLRQIEQDLELFGVAYSVDGKRVESERVVTMYPGPKRQTRVMSATKAMLGLSDEERLEVMGLFCRHCGCIQPEGRGCQCWNDE